MDQYIGKMLDNRYEILERIGTGGMAVVYKAKCHRLNRLVAVKILKSDLAQDADFRRRFNAESQAIAQLSHANIVSVYDVSRGGDTKYIVMELVDGITLKQYMEKRGQLNWREALHFITQIMRGLSHAHSRGIVHRDIKPQNIMVLRDGSVKVADFGIACLEDANQTLTQEALGSVHYISPEQARGDRTDARSDIYSAGVVLYEMLAGRLPFEGESAVSVAIQHLSSIPLAPREINPDIPEQLELICMKAMASDIDRRYRSADEMIADLEAFRKDPGIDLDFDLEDLRAVDESDEPTMMLHTGPVSHTVSMQTRRNNGEREKPAREQGSAEGYHKHGNGKKTALIVGVTAVAVVLVFLLFHSIINSFNAPPINQNTVPELYGRTLDFIYSMPEIEGNFEIVVNEETVSSEEYPENTVARQHPKPGEVRKGENRVIEVWLSSGEEQGVMPDVTIKETAASAKVRMKDLIEKFELTIDDSETLAQFSQEVNAGYIIATVPAAGEPLKKGDTVKMIVSKGPEVKQVPVPRFVGQMLDSVLAGLDKFKLSCDEAVDVEMVDSEEEGGTIVWQSLEDNTMVDEGTTIKFKVSSGLSDYVVTETYELPQDGRDVVRVQVYVGDAEKPQFDNNIHCSDETVTVKLRASGFHPVRIYFDGVLDQTQSHEVQFGG